MNIPRPFHLPLALLLIVSFAGLTADEPDLGQVEISVGRLLERNHYSNRKLDESVSKQLLKNFLEALDYNHLYFTQKDVDAFSAKYGTSLSSDILLGNPESALTIFNLYKRRVEDRVAKIKEMLNGRFEFTSDRTVEVNRQKAPWPKDGAEIEKLWANRIEGEMLQETLNEHAILPPVKVLTRRYDQVLRNLHEQTNEDGVKIFLQTLAQTYDPHTDYMSKSELENFTITMKLSLVGIGAVLRSDEGYAKIAELVPGGPASKDGRLHVGDRIAAVAQGDADFADAVDMKLDKVVEMIRGKKDSTVRLQVIPGTATDPSMRKVIEIKRDEVKLKESEAKAQIIERSGPDGQPFRLGWIVLPSFYADMEHSGAANATSTTKDVRALIARLKQENIQGLVMDLRRNGGGSLDEAVSLTGLFIKRGPVVQAKNNDGGIQIFKDRDPSIAWDGPMIVCTNRLSASASEIFAAALQDYGRAVIVGDQNTFGKGTVQTMVEINRYAPFLGIGRTEAGALKLTIQKFYRIAGGSTQLRGVESDIKLPSLYDIPEYGESALKGPLPYDTVSTVPFDKWDRPLFKNELRQRSQARITDDPEFRYIMEDLGQMKKRLAENKMSLNEKDRRAEIAEMKARVEARKLARERIKTPEQKVYAITLENLDKPELQLASTEKVVADAKPAESLKDAPGVADTQKAEDAVKKGNSSAGDVKSDPASKTQSEPSDSVKPKEEKAAPGASVDDDDAAADEDGEVTNKIPKIDPIKTETLKILTDLIEFSRGVKTAATAPAKQ